MRDGLTCVYCQEKLREILARGDCLTLDHLKPRKAGGGNDARNVFTACYACNDQKGSKTLKEFAAEAGIPYSSIRRRLWQRRQLDVEMYREAARLLLGEIPGVPMAEIVTRNDWQVRRKFRNDPGADAEYAYLEGLAQSDLFCLACKRPFEARVEEVPF